VSVDGLGSGMGKWYKSGRQGCIGGYTRIYAVYQPLVFFWQRILTSFVIIKQGIRRYGDIRIGAGAYTADTANDVALFGRSLNISYQFDSCS